MRIEVWKVVIGQAQGYSDRQYFVRASSAGVAERRAMKVSRKDRLFKPYCKAAEFVGYCHIVK